MKIQLNDLFLSHKGTIVKIICIAPHLYTRKTMVVFEDEDGEKNVITARQFREKIKYQGKVVYRFEKLDRTGTKRVGKRAGKTRGSKGFVRPQK